MNVAIIGLGKIGQMHAQVLRRTGATLLGIDPHVASAQFSSLSELSQSQLQSVDLWIVACPTQFHLASVQSILERNPHSHILIEKPAVLPCQLTQLKELSQKYPEARLSIQDTYGFSPVVDLLMAILKNQEPNGQLIEIAIEMSKNRKFDEMNGRFIDEDWGVAGYEGFHLVSLQSRLRESFNQKTLKTKLITSCDGTLSLRPELSLRHYSLVARQIIESQTIPLKSEFRFRLIKGRFDSGLQFELAFEPKFTAHENLYKNQHAITWCQPGDTPQTAWFVGNHFSAALHKQIHTLRLQHKSSAPKWTSQHRELETVQVMTQENREKQAATWN